MEKALGDKLMHQTLRGKEVKDPKTNSTNLINKLDATILNHIETQFTERVLAVGINEKD